MHKTVFVTSKKVAENRILSSISEFALQKRAAQQGAGRRSLFLFLTSAGATATTDGGGEKWWGSALGGDVSSFTGLKSCCGLPRGKSCPRSLWRLCQVHLALAGRAVRGRGNAVTLWFKSVFGSFFLRGELEVALQILKYSLLLVS